MSSESTVALGRPSVAVIGAGAAGLMAAIFAASNGADVVLIERTADGGRKILISGGGRCNILPSALAPERFVTDSPAHLLRGMLRAWPLHEQRAFFEGDVGLPLALEEESGKLFPASNRARDVRDGLLRVARDRGVRVQFDTSVTSLEATDESWRLGTSGGDLTADRVILATGGLSVPATGSDGTGLALAALLGHRVIPTYPALTPLLTSSPEHAALAGVSLDVRLRARLGTRTIETRGGFLFTHRGYSGPAVLDISHVVTRSHPVSVFPSVFPSSAPSVAVIRVQWCPLDSAAWQKALSAPSAAVMTLVGNHVPARLVEQLMKESGIPLDRRTSALRREERIALIDRLTAYPLPIGGDEGYKKAEVTGGGAALDEVDPRTLESCRAPGLFLCGEMLDAFGPIGGHNFAWAWSTGHAAGLGAAA